MTTYTESRHGDNAAAAIVPPLSLRDLGDNWKKLTLLGVLTILLGVAAILLPHVATLAVELMVGALLVANGIFEGVHALHMNGRRGHWWRVLGALLAIVVGALLLLFPMPGIISLTLVVAAFFIAEGIIKTILASRLRPLQGWGWLLFSGLLAVALGVLIVFVWPHAAPWLLGLLLGIDLVFGGGWLVALAQAGRRWTRAEA